MNKRRLLEGVKWAAVLAIVGVVLGFSVAEKRSATCRELKVTVEHMSGHYFIDEAIISRRIFDLGHPIIGVALDSLRLERMRRSIMEFPSVKDADVYTTVDGTLRVNVSQRKPYFRVVSTTGSGFYIDTDGQPMPLSTRYSARVPVVVGNFDVDLRNRHAVYTPDARMQATITLMDYLHSDGFWLAQTEHIIVNSLAEFELVPRVGSARIVLGQSTDLDAKFNRLKAFYLEMTHKNNLNKYKRINVKYRDQVVCERFF